MASSIRPKAIALTSAATKRSYLQPATSFSTARSVSRTRTRSFPSRTPLAVRPLPTSYITPSSTLTRHASFSAPTANATGTSEDALTWDRFFDLRRKRRYLNLASSLVAATSAVAVGGPLIAQQDIDGWAAQISGIDPFYVLGFTTFAIAAGGWLCGPTFSNSIFRIWARRKGWNQGIAEKEKSFFARIKRYRADPSSSSPQNPIPDYYGEKIASVKDYRRWLKDQRAFNLKKNKNML